MSIKSTYNINRQTAIIIIISKIHSCTNEQLGNILEEFEESYFRNYEVFDNIPDCYKDWDNTIQNIYDF